MRPESCTDTIHLAESATALVRLRRALTRRIWLPASVYAALPYIYILLGCYAIAGALFLQHWSWIVPYLMLTGICAFQAGVAIWTLRRRHRLEQQRRVRKNLPE